MIGMTVKDLLQGLQAIEQTNHDSIVITDDLCGHASVFLPSVTYSIPKHVMIGVELIQEEEFPDDNCMNVKGLIEVLKGVDGDLIIAQGHCGVEEFPFSLNGAIDVDDWFGNNKKYVILYHYEEIE